MSKKDSSSSGEGVEPGCRRGGYEVAMFHPDLGIGGAERLVLDIASSLQSRGHNVTLYTSYFDPDRCFEDARDGSINVYAHFQWIPRHLFGRFHIFFATLRMLLLAMFTMLLFLFGKRPSPDVVIVDQVSIPNLLFRLAGYKVMFYCHFPDLCLASHEGSLLKWYRMLFDWVEERTTGLANHICVNSRFTEERFRHVFPSLVGFKNLSVVNPTFQPPPTDDEVLRNAIEELAEMGITKGKTVVLSINRFERKKNITLLLESMKQMRENGGTLDPRYISIVIAGGFDDRIPENVEHLDELKTLARDFEVSDLCLFLPSCSDEIKCAK
jgi:alpha-1,3/alpha-1,6-mannosyltransferase